MYIFLSKLFLSSRLDDFSSTLQDYSYEGKFVNFSIRFDDIEDANAMMVSILEMQHEKTVHAILRIEQTTLTISIQHSDTEDQEAVLIFIDEINRKALKIKNGKDY